MQLAVLVLLQLLVPTAALERAAAETPKTHAHHHAHAHETEVSLDKRGNSHMRREENELLHQDAFHSIKRSHHKHSHHMSADSVAPEALLHEGPPDDGDDQGQAQQRDLQAQALRASDQGPAVVPLTDIATAEQEEKKIDQVIRSAEEKAGLPDSTKTTPEPQNMEASNEEQEGNALMIAAISIVVMIGTASAGWSIWVARKMYTKKGDPLLEGEGEGEGEGEVGEGQGEEAEGEAEGEAVDAM